MANTENIEAKLAAYVDGELDAADRAEIEQHLASNPQHRKLIQELRVARQYLRELPRAQAPGDVAEVLNAQLERAALLGDVDLDGGEGGSSMRISRWPQIRAVAAILVLTFGLAGLIYWVLPSPKAPPQQVAVVTPEPRDASGASVRKAAPEDTLRADSPSTVGSAVALSNPKEQPGISSPAAVEPGLRSQAETRNASARDEVAARQGDTSAKDAMLGVAGGDRGHSVGTGVATEAQPHAGNMAAGVAAGGAAGGNDLTKLKNGEFAKGLAGDAVMGRAYVLVSAADTSQAIGQVVRYLDDNKIEYRNVPPEEAAQQGLLAGQVTDQLQGDSKANKHLPGKTSDEPAMAPQRQSTAAAPQAEPGQPTPGQATTPPAGTGARDILGSRAAATPPETPSSASPSASPPSTSPSGDMTVNASDSTDKSAAAVHPDSPIAQNRGVSPAPSAATQSNDTGALVNAQEQQSNGQSSAQYGSLEERQFQAGKLARNAMPSSQYLYARNMTRQQAEELSQMVSQPAFNQTAQVVLAPVADQRDAKVDQEQIEQRRVARAGGAGAGANSPATEPSPAPGGDRVADNAPANAGAASDEAAKVAVPSGAVANKGESTNGEADASVPLQAGDELRCRLGESSVVETVTVDREGNVSLPQLGVVRAAGLTAAQLAEAISTRSSVAMKQPVTKDASWTVERIGPAARPADATAAAHDGRELADAIHLKPPTTRPSEPKSSAAPASAPPASAPPVSAAPAGGPLANGSALTAPATQPAADADSRIDVVIVVSGAPAPGSGDKLPAAPPVSPAAPERVGAIDATPDHTGATTDPASQPSTQPDVMRLPR